MLPLTDCLRRFRSRVLEEYEPSAEEVTAELHQGTYQLSRAARLHEVDMKPRAAWDAARPLLMPAPCELY